MSIHRWVPSSHCAEHRQSIRGARESGRGEASSKLGGTSPSTDPHLLGKWRQQDSVWPREKMGPQFGVHRATARLRRRDWPAKGAPNCRLPSGPFLPPVCAESGRRQAGRPFAPFPARGCRPPKCSLAWLLRAGPGHQWSPGRRGGLSNKQSSARPGPEAQAGEKLAGGAPDSQPQA